MCVRTFVSDSEQAVQTEENCIFFVSLIHLINELIIQAIQAENDRQRLLRVV